MFALDLNDAGDHHSAEAVGRGFLPACETRGFPCVCPERFTDNALRQHFLGILGVGEVPVPVVAGAGGVIDSP